jgi:hypothetical protein
MNSLEKEEFIKATELSEDEAGIIDCDNETHGIFSTDGFKQ